MARGKGLGLVQRRSLTRALRDARTSGRVVLVDAPPVTTWLASVAATWARNPAARAVAVGVVHLGHQARLHTDSVAVPPTAAWGPDVGEIPAFRALGNAGLPRDLRVGAAPSTHCVVARGRLALAGEDPSRVVFCGGTSSTLLAPHGLVPVTPTEVIRAWRQHPGADLIIGPWWVDHSARASASEP